MAVPEVCEEMEQTASTQIGEGLQIGVITLAVWSVAVKAAIR